MRIVAFRNPCRFRNVKTFLASGTALRGLASAPLHSNYGVLCSLMFVLAASPRKHMSPASDVSRGRRLDKIGTKGGKDETIWTHAVLLASSLPASVPVHVLLWRACATLWPCIPFLK